MIFCQRTLDIFKNGKQVICTNVTWRNLIWTHHLYKCHVNKCHWKICLLGKYDLCKRHMNKSLLSKRHVHFLSMAETNPHRRHCTVSSTSVRVPCSCFYTFKCYLCKHHSVLTDAVYSNGKLEKSRIFLFYVLCSSHNLGHCSNTVLPALTKIG